MFESLSHSQKGTLEAEREREPQHNRTEETRHPKDEQRNYRCDRVFCMTEWLVHLRSLSSVLNRRLKSPRSSEWFYESSAQPVLAGVAWRPSRQTPRKQKRKPSSNFPRITPCTFLVISTETK